MSTSPGNTESERHEMTTIVHVQSFGTDHERKLEVNSEDTIQQQPPTEQGANTVLSPPPNGGYVAWMQCVDAFLLWFASWGLVNSFGVFQAYYTSNYFSNDSPSRISWIGSLQLCIFILGSVVVGPLYDLGNLRRLLVVGLFLIVFGMILTSVQTTYVGVLLVQGLCMGLGMTCTFIPLVSVLPPYFSSKRALAMGIAAAGSSVGAIVFTVTFQQLISRIGFGWTTRVIALILLITLIWPIVSMRKRVPDSPRRAFVDLSALREPTFVLTLCSMFVAFMGLYIPYFYIEIFSQRTQVLTTGDEYLTKYLIVLLNIGSLFGRLLPNILADKFGPWNTIVLSSALTGAVGFCWIAVEGESGLISFCVFYGFFSGSFVALVPVIWATLSPDPKMLGTRTGMVIVPMAIGLLIGNPIAGALVEGRHFLRLQVFCGATMICASFTFVAGRFIKGRSSSTLKV